MARIHTIKVFVVGKVIKIRAPMKSALAFFFFLAHSNFFFFSR